MNVQSMTGFASVLCEFTSKEVGTIIGTLSVKTLNSRFFEALCRVPPLLAVLEQPMAQRSKELLKRGSVTINIQISTPLALKGAIIPSLAAAQQYVDALRTIKKHCAISGDVTISDLVTLPYLFETSEPAMQEALREYFMEQLEKALQVVVQARVREGASLAHELVALMQVIGVCIEELAPIADRITLERRERFLSDIQNSITSASPEAREVHIQALYHNLHTIDTREEIVRLRTHRENFLATLQDAELQKGKKLDFILQELLREINTLSAKLTDTSAITPVLTVKTRLEQAREQIQNIV